MKKIHFFILSLCSFLFCACDTNKGKVEEMANQFIEAINAKDKPSIYNFYPEANNISNMTLPDSIQRGNITVEKNDSNDYVVSIDNVRQQKLVFRVKGDNQIELKETYGILVLDSAAMELAIKTGVPLKNLPDLFVSKLLDLEGEYLDYLNDVYSYAIRGSLIYESGTWNATSAYGGSVSVTQPIRNTGDVAIKGSEYNVEFTFYSPNGTSSGRQKIIHEGLDLEPNEATTLYLSPNSAYAKACFAHDFSWNISFVYKNQSPISTLLKYVKFTGNEYNDYQKDRKEKSDESKLTLNLKGTLGLSNDAVFKYDGNTDSGELTFTVNGNVNKRLLELDSYDEADGHLVITESYESGEKVGTFDGTWKDGTYKGKFKNTKGITLDFNLKSE